MVYAKTATKQETELRVAYAAELVAEGQAYSSITSLVAENMEFQEEEPGRLLQMLIFCWKMILRKGT